jgi:hypothetical protein
VIVAAKDLLVRVAALRPRAPQSRVGVIVAAKDLLGRLEGGGRVRPGIRRRPPELRSEGASARANHRSVLKGEATAKSFMLLSLGAGPDKIEGLGRGLELSV